MINDMFTDTFSIYKMEEVETTPGAVKREYSLIASNIPGKVRQLSARETLQYERLMLKVSHRIYCPITKVDLNDMLKDQNGNVYEVKTPNNPMNLGEFLQIDCDQVTDREIIDSYFL